jgi:hypothetical protein
MDKERLGLGGKEKAAGQAGIVEGFFAEAIPGKKQATLLRVPQRERKHALDTLKAIGSLLRIGVQQHLDISPRREHMTARTELVTQSIRIVDLAIGDEVESTVLASERLLTSNQINHAQTPHDEPYRTFSPQTTLVRAAMGKSPPHGL